MADMTATTMASWLPEKWSKLATVTYRSNTVLADLMDRRWEPEVLAYGDTVNIPNFTQNTGAADRSTFGTGAALTWTATTEAQTQLLVNKMPIFAHRIPVEDGAQAMPNYLTLLIEGLAQAIALKVDNDIADDDTNGLDALTAIGADNVDITEDVVLEGETQLNSVNAPLADRFMVVSPASRASLMKIESFRNSLFKGSVGNLQGDKGAGYLGPLYTLAVYMSNNLGAGTNGKKNAIWHKECIAMAMQKKVSVVKGLNIADGLFNETAAYAVWGLKLVKSTFGREVDGK